jgi:hypothetical protein
MQNTQNIIKLLERSDNIIQKLQNKKKKTMLQYLKLFTHFPYF